MLNEDGYGDIGFHVMISQRVHALKSIHSFLLTLWSWRGVYWTHSVILYQKCQTITYYRCAVPAVKGYSIIMFVIFTKYLDNKSIEVKFFCYINRMFD